jgi:O-antigen/teichoic acid export membrane protein
MKDTDNNSFSQIDVSSLASSSRTLRSKVVSGSVTLLAGSVLVGAANLVYNITVARLLGPVGFGHVAAVYTLLMLMSAVTLAFQIVCAKLVANHESASEKAAVYAGLHQRAWRFGVGIGLLLVLARNVVSSYLNLPDPTLIVLLGIGTAFYIPLGARRGGMQGTYSFNLLAINLILEGLVRLGGAFLLIKAGMGVRGAVLASVAGVVLSYLFGIPGAELRANVSVKVKASFREGLQAIVFFVGQVVINNFDIILVNHFFPARAAGLYAAIALVGRVVNMCAWSVVNTMFPVSAGARSEERGARPVLLMSLLLVVLIVACVVFGLWMIPSFIWNLVFGSQFAVTGFGAISSLLVLYAVTSGVYSLSSVIVAYEMSRKIGNTAWLQLAFSGALILGIYFLHGSLREVVMVQLVLMTLLLVLVLLPVLRLRVLRSEAEELAAAYTDIRKRKVLTEEEVIAEFLKSEFHHPDFDRFRARFEHLVAAPNLSDADENALRRALLFLRQGRMWRELPTDTQWYEVELTARDLARIRVFPRARWRQISQGSFYIADITERIRVESENDSEDEFFRKLHFLGGFVQERGIHPAVLLIGVNEKGPLTIIDGNHRITAGMLVSPSTMLKRFRFICGLSPRMRDCCWYETNLKTLWRYAKNLIKNLSYDPRSEIYRFLQSEP